MTELAEKKQYRNNKNGNVYLVQGKAIDRTNSRDGTPVIIYSPVAKPDEISVREETEFYQKFTEVELPL